MAVYVSYNESTLESRVSAILNEKLEKGLSSNVKKAAAGHYALMISKYVPYKKGKLLGSATIVPSGDGYAVEYSAKSKKGFDYAEIQYETPFENRTTPGTYDHWNRHLTRSEREEFYQQVAKDVAEEMNG